MSMRRGLPHLVALVLGIAAALLAACGSSTKGGIPQADASDIKSQLEDVRSRVADGNCDELPGQLRQVSSAIDALPRSVDNRLVSALRDGADRLQGRAVQDCNDNNTPTETQTTAPPPQTVPTATQTQPPPETTTDTAPAETTTEPPATTEPPTATVTPVPPPEPAPVPPPPVVTPGGGTPPDSP